MWCASPTAASTRCAGGSRTRRSVIEAARSTRSIGSASSCLTGYERLDERGHDRVLLGLRHGDPHDELLGRLVGQGVGPRRLPDRRSQGGHACSSTRPSSAASADEVEEIRSLGDTLERWRTEILNHHRTGASNGPTEGLKLVREEGQACRTWLHLLRALPAPGAPSCRWCHLAQASITAEDPNPLSPLQRVGPVIAKDPGPRRQPCLRPVRHHGYPS